MILDSVVASAGIAWYLLITKLSQAAACILRLVVVIVVVIVVFRVT